MRKLGIAICVLGLTACAGSSDDSVETKEKNESIEQETSSEEHEVLSFENEVEFARFFAEKLQEGDAETLKNYTNETILLSPYAFIDTNTVRNLSVEELLEENNDQIYFWGIYDGRGDSIQMTNSNYLNDYVFNVDVASENVEISSYLGKPKAYGSELHNVHEMYPDAKLVEFYQPPSEEGYMDWNALI